ncbi:MAG TPA: penicillin-binding transpeptidase domain-containing protein [Dictyobacter sp.]|jgi:cell division protein FtsI/penicillin-binding protein 2|nr:penicillin-binding transpeptidase domain-containing protein [Dictyobacter sp.]
MNVSSNIRRLAQVFILFFLALSGGLVYWQVNVAGQVAANPHNNRKCLFENAPLRGRIFDRNGILLAYSSPDANASCGYVRHYTDPSLAGLIGYYVAGYQATGLEAQYDAALNGKDEETMLGNVVNATLHQPPIGEDIYLTIDDRIQKTVAADFKYSPMTVDNDLLYKSNRGSVVVSDPHTGEILALLSEPSFDPNKMVQTLMKNDLSYYNQLAANKDNPLLFRPLQALYTPGSTFKTVTLMAALDSENTTLGQFWSRDQAYGVNGKYYLDNFAITGDNLGVGKYTFHFPITTEYAYANSDNLVFAQIGLNTGQDTWLRYTRKLYLDQQVPFDLPLVKSTVQHADKKPLTRLEFALNAFGQGVDNVTPLQMSLVDNTVANDGVLMQPMLVSKVTDHNKNPLKTYSPQQLSSVVSQDTARQVRQAMLAVAKCGGGFPIPDVRNTQWGLIGKTGTGQIGGGQAAQGWMITQAPYYVNNPDQPPALTIVAMKENSGEGAYAVGPMEARMYNDIFSKGYVRVAQPTNPSPYAYCPPLGLFQTH